MGTVLGGFVFGYVTDLMYSRRAPATVIGLVLSAILQFYITLIDAQNKYIFSLVIFILGALVGGVVCIISAVACSDLVIKLILNI